MQMPREWTEAEVPEGGKLLKKETYEYHNEKGEFSIEVFENLKGEFYALGVPLHGDKLIVYGSHITMSRAIALSTVMDKIDRE